MLIDGQATFDNFGNLISGVLPKGQVNVSDLPVGDFQLTNTVTAVTRYGNRTTPETHSANFRITSAKTTINDQQESPVGTSIDLGAEPETFGKNSITLNWLNDINSPNLNIEVSMSISGPGQTGIVEVITTPTTSTSYVINGSRFTATGTYEITINESVIDSTSQVVPHTLLRAHSNLKVLL